MSYLGLLLSHLLLFVYSCAHHEGIVDSLNIWIMILHTIVHLSLELSTLPLSWPSWTPWLMASKYIVTFLMGHVKGFPLVRCCNMMSAHNQALKGLGSLLVWMEVVPSFCLSESSWYWITIWLGKRLSFSATVVQWNEILNSVINGKLIPFWQTAHWITRAS